MSVREHKTPLRQTKAVNQLKLAINILLDLQASSSSSKLRSNNFNSNALSMKEKNGFCACVAAAVPTQKRNIEHVEKHKPSFFACSVCTFFLLFRLSFQFSRLLLQFVSVWKRTAACGCVVVFLSFVFALLQAFSFNGKVKGDGERKRRRKNFKLWKDFEIIRGEELNVLWHGISSVVP